MKMFNRYRQKRPKVDARIFDSVLSHTRRSDASEKEEKITLPLLDVFACGQVSSPRLYRLNPKNNFNHKKVFKPEKIFTPKSLGLGLFLRVAKF